MLIDQYDTAIKHLSLACATLEELAKQSDSMEHAHERAQSALVGVLLNRRYQYDFAPLNDAMKAWR